MLSPVQNFYPSMRPLLPILLLLFWSQLLAAQQHDNFWVFGLGGGSQSLPDDEFANVWMVFDSVNNVVISVHQEHDIHMNGTCATLCDSAGNVLFYTNGEVVYGPNHTMIPNGTLIPNFPSYGSSFPQGAIALPHGGENNRYSIFFMDVVVLDTTAAGYQITQAILEKNPATDVISVVEKKLIVNDTISYGKISAVKHANGRDWWILVFENDTKFVYQILLNAADGSTAVQKIAVEHAVTDGLGQSTFTPDGARYIAANSDRLYEPFIIHVYDFDRCTGLLSNQQKHSVDVLGSGAGVSVSANSRFLYIMRTTQILQYDLWASDIWATETVVAEIDGFVSGIYPAYFANSQIGPNGRIYIHAFSGSFHLHQILFPNRKGMDCAVRQHDIFLDSIYNNRTIPNFPNYRLGPIDGSVCDTLGYDNHPLANFRWDLDDTLEPFRIAFSNLSAYAPTAWAWNFGDGSGSAEFEPVHVFPGPGLYQVCLTASNDNDSHMLCRQVLVGATALAQPIASLETSIYPNPVVDGKLQIFADVQPGVLLQAELYDMAGRRLAARSSYGGMMSWEIPDLPPGVYVCRLSSADGRTGVMKVVLR